MQEVHIWSVESYLHCDTDTGDEQSHRACVTMGQFGFLTKGNKH